MRYLLILLALPLQEPASSIERRRLTAPTVISGVRCASTGRAYAELYGDGSLRECPLARDTAIAGHLFTAGTWVLFGENRKLRSAWLIADTKLGGHECLGAGYKEFHVTFHPDESLRSCYLPRDIVIDGVPCIHGSFWTELRGGGKSVASFHPDGRLAGCQLSRRAVILGTPLSKWTRVSIP